MNLPYSEYLNIALFLFSSVILFLFAVDSLGKELLDLATESFRKIVSKLAKNRLSGALIGAISTAIVQSSTAITTVVMTLVNTGIISFHQSLAIIFGSSIGTTLTAQLALLSSTPIAPIFLIVGFFSKFFPKKFRLASKPIFLMGFVLFSLNLLTISIEPLRSNQAFLSAFSSLSSPFLAYIISCFFTVLVHSSSVTSGIIVVLAAQGVISLDIAIPMILGANLGTAVSSLMVTADYSLFAKRAGFANFVFKAVGSLFFLLFVDEFSLLLTMITSNLGQQAALGHLLFNTINTLVFLLLLDPFESLINKLLPGTEEEVLFQTKYIEEGESKKLSESFNDIKKEIGHSIENTIRIYKKALTLYYNPSQKIAIELKKYETLNDYLDDEITKALLSTTETRLPRKLAKASILYIKISNTIEQLGDLGSDFSKVFIRMHTLDVSPDEIPIGKLTEIFNMLIDLFKSIEVQINNPKESELLAIKLKEEEIYGIINDEFNIHVRKLQESQAYHGNIFVDAISIIELSVSKVREIRKLLLKYVREFN
ncbi:MAG TPA: Na/Pi symporter [Candidatus Dojkabacteria bacterium]|nr:Na/Pi symporter [Candidatus Dojkabacteria bacterium]HRZ85002.1 Na/Pi symporter [Candidatus Dojkabacteria bacterium]